MAFDQLVLSGGGTRCFWIGGFLHVAEGPLGLAPARISGVSGGALCACGHILHQGEYVRDTMIDIFANQDRNLPLHEPFDDGDGMSPHQRLYRKVVDTVLTSDALAEIARFPSLQILLAHPPNGDWPRLSGTAAVAAYEADCLARSTPHMELAGKLGMEPDLADATAAAHEGTLNDLIAAAATIPPAFDPPLWNGRPVVDAGMLDQAPMPDPDEGISLILLTKRFDNLPDMPGRTYVMPSGEVPADKIDFTDPDKIRRTWEMGEEDARRFLDEL